MPDEWLCIDGVTHVHKSSKDKGLGNIACIDGVTVKPSKDIISLQNVLNGMVHVPHAILAMLNFIEDFQGVIETLEK